jgi:hypothetical protein
MKNKIKYLGCFLISAVSLVYGDEDPFVEPEWINAKDLIVDESGVYIGTVRGTMKLEVIDYDESNNSYLVK